jgi:hypothetical protein
MGSRWRANYEDARYGTARNSHKRKRQRKAADTELSGLANGCAGKTRWVTDSVWLLTFHVSFLLKSWGEVGSGTIQHD